MLGKQQTPCLRWLFSINVSVPTMYINRKKKYIGIWIRSRRIAEREWAFLCVGKNYLESNKKKMAKELRTKLIKEEEKYKLNEHTKKKKKCWKTFSNKNKNFESICLYTENRPNAHSVTPYSVEFFIFFFFCFFLFLYH